MEMIVEFGSNACKIMQCREDTVYLDYRIPLRLISHLDTQGELDEAGLQGMLGIIRDISERFSDMSRILLIGTAALRKAKNSLAIQERIQAETALSLRILSEAEEAAAAYKGIVSALHPQGKVLAFDIGGGSTEIIYGEGNQMQDFSSLPFGAVSLDQKFRIGDPYSNCAFHSLEMYIDKQLKIHAGKDLTLIGTGGSVSTLAAVAAQQKSFDAFALNGTVLSRGEIFRQVLLYRSLSIKQICAMPGMDSARADLMLPATLVICSILHKAQADKVIVSTRGVRHGIICQKGVRTASS